MRRVQPVLPYLFVSVVFHLALFVMSQFFFMENGSKGGVRRPDRMSGSVTTPLILSVPNQRKASVRSVPSSGGAPRDEASISTESAIASQGGPLGRDFRPVLRPDPAPVYFKAAELSVRPRLLEHVDLVHPEGAIEKLTGKVVLRLFVGAEGAVDQVFIEAADLPEIYQEVARNSFILKAFSPGLIGEVAVGSQLLVEVVYE